MKYVCYPGGRFGNRLYYILQQYINNTIYLCEYKPVHRCLDLLGLSKYYVASTKEPVKYINNYCQSINRSFNVNQLNCFIKENILTNNYFLENIKKYRDDNSLFIHIRNGDFILKKNIQNHSRFNRFKYLEDAICNLPSFSKITVVSDDISECKKYEKILSKITNNIQYVQSQDYLDDFLRLCSNKYKIIWNSTFSIWSSFISDCLFENEDKFTVHPGWFCFAHNDVYKDNWRSINV